MVDFTEAMIPECQSLIQKWLATHLDEIDIINACKTQNKESILFIKKCYLELSGYALICEKLKVPITDKIVNFLNELKRVDFILSLSARESEAFSQYGMAIAYAGQNPAYQKRINHFINHLPVFNANSPSEWAASSALDTIFALKTLGSKLNQPIDR